MNRIATRDRASRIVIMLGKKPQITTDAVANPKPFHSLIKGYNRYLNAEVLLKEIDQQKWTEKHLSLEELITVSPK